MRPDLALPRLRAGEILVAQGRWEEAERVLRLALSVEPNSPEIWIAVGQTLLGQGEDREAERSWLEALTRDPTNQRAWLELANLYIMESRWEQSIDALEHATVGRTAEPAALYLMGLLQAWEDAERATRLLELARARGGPEVQEDSVRALRVLEELGGSPPDSRGWAHLGELYLALDQPEMAFYALSRGVELGDAPRLRAYLGYAAWRIGRDGDAAVHLRTARRQDPQDALPLYFLGLYHRSRGEAHFALNSLQAALVRDPQNPAFYAAMGDLLHGEKEYLAAREAYLRATEAAPLNAEFHLLRAAFHLSTLLWTEDAIEAARTAVFLAPEEPLAHEYLGWGLYLAGELEAAEAAMERAIALDPGSARAHYRSGVIRIAIGSMQDARRDLLRAMDLDSEGAYRHRAELALGNFDSP